MRSFGRRTFDVIEAARSGTSAEVEEAIHLGADISGADEHGMTALHHASARGNLPIVSILIKYGAELDVQDATGMVALHAAVMHDRVQVAVRLMLAGCKVDETDLRGYTPLHIAASNGNTTLVHLLVELGRANLMTKTKLMLTPLLCSVERRRLATIRYLADRQSPAFMLPAERSDFAPGSGKLSHRLSRFLKTLPPRPAQAIEEELNVRIALGPREESESLGLDMEGEFDIEAMMRERECNVEARKQAVEEEERKEEQEQDNLLKVLAYDDDETGRSETWVSRRKSASFVTALIRRRLVQDANVRNGVAESLSGACRGKQTLLRAFGFSAAVIVQEDGSFLVLDLPVPLQVPHCPRDPRPPTSEDGELPLLAAEAAGVRGAHRAENEEAVGGAREHKEETGDDGSGERRRDGSD
eukprot:746313-Hanusia_phi.AAC.3